MRAFSRAVLSCVLTTGVVSGAQHACVSTAQRQEWAGRTDPNDNQPRRWLAASDGAGKLAVIVIDDAIWSTAAAVDGATGEARWRKPLAGSVRQMAVSADGNRIALAYSSVFCPQQHPHLQLWDTKTGELVAALAGW